MPRAHEPRAWLLSVDAGEIVQPHPEGGWPEFTMTLRFYVTSDDPEVVADVQRRVFERDWDSVGWTRNDDPIKITLSPGEWGAIIDAARAGMPDVEPTLKDDTYAAIEKLADLGGWT